MAKKPEAPADEGPRVGIPDFSKLFSGMKLPSFGEMEPVLHAYRRNLEALIAANQVAFQGAEAYAKRHMEIVQQGLAELTQSMQAMATSGSPPARIGKQAELLKEAHERTVAQMKELGQLIQRANEEAVSLLNARFAEAMDDIKNLMAKAGQRAP